MAGTAPLAAQHRRDQVSDDHVNPGDPPIVDILCFERPVPAAEKLKLVLPALVREEKGTYQFEIPAAAWK